MKEEKGCGVIAREALPHSHLSQKKLTEQEAQVLSRRVLSQELRAALRYTSPLPILAHSRFGFTVTHSTVLRLSQAQACLASPLSLALVCICTALLTFTFTLIYLDLPWLCTVCFTMCDPSLTDVGGRSSEFPEEAEPWREVDLTDVEEKLKGLKMEQEADFSEPEQVQLVQPVLAAGSALPSTSSTSDHAADGAGTLPSSADGSALPSSTDGAKLGVEEKKKVIVKSPPSSAQKALADLRPFLRFTDGKDSDAEAVKPKASLPTSLPRASSRAPSMSRSRSKSKHEKVDKEKRSKTPRSRSRPLSPGSRDRVVGCILGQPELAGFTHELDPAPIYYTSHSALPTNLGHPKWKQDFLQWTIDDCRLSWKKGELAWVNLHIGMYFYTPSVKYPLDHFRCMAACSVSGDPTLPARFLLLDLQAARRGRVSQESLALLYCFLVALELDPCPAAPQRLGFSCIAWRCHFTRSCLVFTWNRP